MSDQINYILTLKDLFSKRMDGAIKQTEKLDKKMDSLRHKGNNLSSSFGGLGSVIAGAFSVGAIVSFGRSVVDSLSKYEMFMSSIKTMLGGNTKMAEILNSQLVGLAKTTPFSLEEVRTGSKELLAYGFNVGSLVDNLSMLGNVAAGVGQPLGDITYLFGTLKTQGRAFAKDIYQFTGRGIPIVRELAKQFKTTDSNVMKLVTDGKVGFREIDAAFKSMTSEGGIFFNLMQEQSKTVGGMISNFGDSWEQLKTNIGKSQRGIIANTVSWASNMVSLMNEKFRRDNFIFDAAGDKPQSESYVNPGASFTSKIIDDLLDKNNFNAIVNPFTEKWIGKYDKLAGLSTGGSARAVPKGTHIDPKTGKQEIDYGVKTDPNLFASASSPFLKELIAERKTLELRRKNGIDEAATVTQLKVLDKIFADFKGLKDFKNNKEAPDKPGAPKKEDLGTGISTSTGRQDITIIVNDGLVHEMNFVTQNNSDNPAKVKESISRVLLEVLNDANSIAKNR